MEEHRPGGQLGQLANFQTAQPIVPRRPPAFAEATMREMNEEQITRGVITLLSSTLPTRVHVPGSGSSAESCEQEDHLIRALAEQEGLIDQVEKPVLRISLA